jgi:hypothetical protein
VKLHADDSTLTFTSRTGSDTLEHFSVAALAHHPFHRRFPKERRDTLQDPLTGVSVE